MSGGRVSYERRHSLTCASPYLAAVSFLLRPVRPPYIRSLSRQHALTGTCSCPRMRSTMSRVCLARLSRELYATSRLMPSFQMSVAAFAASFLPRVVSSTSAPSGEERPRIPCGLSMPQEDHRAVCVLAHTWARRRAVAQTCCCRRVEGERGGEQLQHCAFNRASERSLCADATSSDLARPQSRYSRRLQAREGLGVGGRGSFSLA